MRDFEVIVRVGSYEDVTFKVPAENHWQAQEIVMRKISTTATREDPSLEEYFVDVSEFSDYQSHQLISSRPWKEEEEDAQVQSDDVVQDL
jgi:hypothetical protein